MFNKSQLFFIYKTKSVNLFQEMTTLLLYVRIKTTYSEQEQLLVSEVQPCPVEQPLRYHLLEQ